MRIDHPWLALRWFVIGLLASSATTYLVLRMSGTTYRVTARTGVAHAKVLPGELPDPGSVGADPPGRRSALASEPGDSDGAPATPAQLRQHIEDMVAAGERNRGRYSEILEEMIHSGGPEGLAQVLELMRDPNIVFDWRSDTFLELLRDQQDPAIFPAVQSLLAHYDDIGLTSARFRESYYRIAAMHGGSAGGEFLLDRIDSSQDPSAIRAVADVQDASLGEEFLARLESSDDRVAVPMAKALAAWEDPHVSARLEFMGLDTGSPLRLRKAAMKALGDNVKSPEEAERLTSHYYSAASSSERRVVLDCISGIASNRSLGDAARQGSCEPVLLSGLADGDRAVQMQAVGVVNDSQVLHTEAMEAALERLLESGLDERDQTTVRFALGAVRHTLRSTQ